jgi:hypothetical protein
MDLIQMLGWKTCPSRPTMLVLSSNPVIPILCLRLAKLNGIQSLQTREEWVNHKRLLLNPMTQVLLVQTLHM